MKKRSAWFIIFGAVCLFAVTACLPNAAAAASTTLVRELAKNNSPVSIVVSGAELNDIATAFQQTILRHGDNKHKPTDVTIAQMSDLATPSLPKGAIIIVALTKELPQSTPVALAGLLPSVQSNSTVSQVSCQSGSNGFIISIVAPDIERVSKLLPFVFDRAASNFKQLPFSESFVSNKIAVFSSPANKSLVENWGCSNSPRCWDYYNWYSLSDCDTIKPEDIAESHKIFVIDRSTKDVTPQPASDIMNGIEVKNLTTVIAHKDDPSRGRDVVFSAASTRILKAKLAHYRGLDAVSSAPATEEPVDLRDLGKTALLISADAGSVPEGDRNAVDSLVGQDMHDMLGIMVEPRNSMLAALSTEVTLEQLQGATDTANMLRRKEALKHIWLYRITSYTGRTEFSTDQHRVTDLPAPFDESEPTKPSDRVSTGFLKDRRKTDDEMARDLAQYNKDHDKWDSDRRDYNDRVVRTQVTWDQPIYRYRNAQVHGILYLLDMSDSGHTLWQRECDTSIPAKDIIRVEHVTVRGYTDTPNSPSLPENMDTCPPEMLKTAARSAADGALNYLQEQALMPDGTNSGPPDTKDGSTDSGSTGPSTPPDGGENNKPPVPTVARVPKVAAIDGQVVTITFGKDDGVAVGDHVHIGLDYKEIKDPDSGKVLDRRMMSSVWLHVTSVGATSDCVLDTNADASANLAKITVGLPVILGDTPPAVVSPTVAPTPHPVAATPNSA